MPTQEQYSLLTAWDAAKKTLAEAMMTERELRAKVIEQFSEVTDEMFSGTETIDLQYDSYDLKIVHNLDYKLDNANDYEKVDNALDRIENLIGEVLTDRLVKRKLELSVSEYKKLGDVSKEAVTVINEVLTVKPASKSIEIKKRAR